MEESINLVFSPDAKSTIVSELGSMNAFYDRLRALIEREARGQASLIETSEDLGDGSNRGGDVVAIVTAITGLIASLSPVVIAWLHSRQFEAEETTTTDKSGEVTHTLRVRNGRGS